MSIKRSFIATSVLSKWAAFLFVILAGFLIFSWGQRSFAARQTAAQAGAGGSPFSARVPASQSSSSTSRQTPATRENFDARGGLQRTLVMPPGAGTAETNAGAAPRGAGQTGQVSRLKRARPSVSMRWSSLTVTPSRLSSHTDTLSEPIHADAGAVARGFLKGNDDLFRLSVAEVDGLKEARRYRTEHNGVTHLTLQQEIGGIEIFQAAMTMHLNREGAIISASGELMSGAARSINLSQPKIPAVEALRKAAEQSGAEIKEQPRLIISSGGADSRQEFAGGQSFGRDVKARLVYFPLAAEQVRLAWELVIWMRETPDVYLILIDAEQNTMLFRQNLTSYEENPLRPHGLVYTGDSPRPDLPHTSDSPPIVERQDVPFVAAPFNGVTIFQPSDPHYDWWASIPANGLISNNADVRLDRDSTPNQPDLPRLEVPDGNFSFPIDLAIEPTAATNSQAAQVNLFYWINRYHDILYSFGFNEAAGNFQTNNFGLGGMANDAVIGDTQDGSFINNATFTSPPDGQPGRVQMFLWNLTSPQIDGSFDQGILIHELTHGVSSRLVSNSMGLGHFQSLSMGEGWSDYLGLVLLRSEQDDPNAVYPVGGYVINDYARGGRRYPYSTDLQINPLTFKNVGDVLEVHAAGEIWCNMLWEMRALLIGRYGFSEGQRQSIQLVIDGLKLTPTFPSFIDARDAILLADRVNNQGANQCLIWQAFAKRGMGFYADTMGAGAVATVESFDVAPACSAIGSLRLDKRSYVDNETVYITLSDANAVSPVIVDVTSSRTGDRERVKLEPAASIPGLFNGLIRLDDGRGRDGDGMLQGSDEARDQIRVVYLDRDTDLSDSLHVTATAEWTRELVILDDDVERGNQTWLTNGTWAITGDLSGSPTHSWRIMGTSIDPVFRNDLFLTSPLLDLTGLGEVTLSFSHSRQLTRTRDYGHIEISVDDGVTWTMVESFTDNQAGFVPSQVRLQGLEGRARARLRFHLASPLIGRDPVLWAVDDIRLTARSSDPRAVPPGDAPAPIITAVSPAFGSPDGGTPVIISGANFTESDDTSVTFGDVPAVQVTVLGSSTITAVTPAHKAGPVNVRVTNRRGTARQSRGFTYYEPGGPIRQPVLGNISPASGSVLGGTTVTLTGTNFTPETAVLFGSQEAPVTFVNVNTLRAVAPAASAASAIGAIDVTVRNGGRQMTRAGAYRYVATTPPAVQVLSPQGGENFYTGSLVTIRWQSSDNREVVRHKVRLTYLPASGFPFPPTERTIDIAPELGRDLRSFTWAVPTTFVPGTQARIYVTVIDDDGAETEAVSDQFAIVRRWEDVRIFPLRIPPMGQYVADENYIYAIGRVPPSQIGLPPVDAILRFDPETNTWTDQLALPPTILNNARAVYLNGKIYIPGGSTLNTFTVPLHFAYDIAANTWSTQAEVPGSTALYAVAADNVRGVYYRTGGSTLTDFSAAVRMYNPSTDTWTDLPPMNTARDSHSAVVFEGKLYVAGGRSPAGDLIGGEVYDFETGQWSPIAPLNRLRLGAEAAVVKDASGNPYWLFMGSVADGVNDAEVYDFRNNRWIELDETFVLARSISTPGPLPISFPMDGSGVIGGFFYAFMFPSFFRLPIAPLEMSFSDRPPLLTVPVTQVGVANTEIKFKVSASDLGSGVPLSITVEGLPARARFTTNVITNNRTEGTFKWTPTVADIGSSFTLAFTASDGRFSDTRVVTVRVVECSALTLANALGSKEGRLTADSIATAFGANLAIGVKTAESEQLPFELAGTTVTINGIPASVFSVSPDRVDFLVPPTVEPGDATVVIRNPGGNYSIGTAQIVELAPAILAGDAGGSSDTAPLALGNGSNGIGLRLPRLERLTGRRPDLLTLYATGIRRARAANPSDKNGVAESVEVMIGGYPARVLYAGAHARLRGLDQIIVEIPAGLAGSGQRQVEVVVSVDGVFADRTVISLK
jgi:uncharacterized protein (TIGR03437 family)